LDVVNGKEKDKIILRLETPLPIKESSIIKQIRIDIIENWFQSIVGETMQSNFKHILLSLTSIYFGNILDHLVEASIHFPIQNLIPQVSWMLE
jgi:hypothetical protein